MRKDGGEWGNERAKVDIKEITNVRIRNL